MGDKAFKSRQEHVDERKSEDERMIVEKIRTMRKKIGKKNQRRSRGEECSAPKSRKMESDKFKEARWTWRDRREGREEEK